MQMLRADEKFTAAHERKAIFLWANKSWTEESVKCEPGEMFPDMLLKPQDITLGTELLIFEHIGVMEGFAFYKQSQKKLAPIKRRTQQGCGTYDVELRFRGRMKFSMEEKIDKMLTDSDGYVYMPGTGTGYIVSISYTGRLGVNEAEGDGWTCILIQHYPAIEI